MRCSVAYNEYHCLDCSTFEL